MSLKLKLTALFVAVLGGSLISYGVYFSNYITTLYKDEFDIMLYNFAVEVGQAMNVDLLGDITISKEVLQEERKIFPFSLSEVVMQVRTVDGTSIARSKNLSPLHLPFDSDRLYSQARFDTWVSDYPIHGQRHFRTVDVLLKGRSRPLYILQVGAPDHFLHENTRKLNATFFYSIPVILGLSGLLGFSLASAALQPVRRITDTAKKISAKELKERIPLPRSHDEIWELTRTLNELLDRLEKAFTSQESFISHASHQLKTPLAILRNDIDDLKKELTGQGHTATALTESMKEEVEYLSRLVENLLLLAKMDSSEEQQLYLEEIRLDEVVITSVSKLSRLAKKKSVHLNVDYEEPEAALEEDAFVIKGDANLLSSLFEALIENAVKYSPEEGQVDVLLCTSSNHNIAVKILDNGPGIPTDEKQQIFSRFYRGKNHSNKVPGSGLGLSVAKRIAELHKAELKVINRKDQNGAEVELSLQKAQPKKIASFLKYKRKKDQEN